MKFKLTLLLMLFGFALSAQKTQIRYFQLQDAANPDRLLISKGSGNEWEEGVAADVPITDAGAYFSTDNLEAALQELGSTTHVAVTLGGGNSTALTLSGQQLTLSDSQLEQNLDVDDLILLTGVADGSQNLGTFTGTTIADNATIYEALEDLEAAVEGSGGTDDQTIDELSFSGTIISASLESDGQAPQTVDIKAVVANAYVQQVFDIAAGSSTVTVSNDLPTDTDGVVVTRNGLMQSPGAGQDFVFTSSTVLTFNTALAIGEKVIVKYPDDN
jgi:hypothetical protein